METPSDLDAPTEQIEESAETEVISQETDAPSQPEWKPSIFISHKRDVALDDNTARSLANDLRPLCSEVYLDLEGLPGEEFRKRIKEGISKADFVIALLSADSNGSEWVTMELLFADHYNRQRGGRPVIIPVRLGYTDLYDPAIVAYVQRFNEIFWDTEDATYPRLLEQLASAIKHERLESDRPDRMGGFVVHESRKERFRAAYVEPPKLAEVGASLREQENLLVWITGDAGVRNYVALSLAVQGRPEKVYEVSRPRSWSDINGTGVRDAAIVCQDVSPSLHFEEKTPRAELESLKALVGRGNLVLITLPDDAFPEVEQEIRKEDFAYDYRLRVGHETYDEPSKLDIFRRLLELARRTGEITDLYDWAYGLTEEDSGASPRRARGQTREATRDRFNEAIRKSTPAEIERFFTLHLRQVRKPSDFLRLLQQSAASDEEVHSWFVSLDDSTRCFLLALSIFSELDGEQFWEKYKLIVQALKKLDPGLALMPVGIGRQRSNLYVTADGPADFVDTRIADAVHEEISRNYREYFIELLPELREWSVPAGREQRDGDVGEERKLKAEEGQEVRSAIARMVGKVGRHGIGDLTSLLDYWAADPINKVREAVGTALEQTATSSAGAEHALGLLEKWCHSFSANNQTLFRTNAAALALGRIASTSVGRAPYPRALACLRKLTGDNRGRVRFWASIALRKMARKVPLGDLEDLLSRAAQDENTSTRINVAQALNDASFHNENDALDLFTRWASSQDVSLRWVAICSLLLWRRRARGRKGLEAQVERKAREVRKFLPHDAATVASVFLETMSDDHHKDTVWPVFTTLVGDDSDGTKGALLSGLAQLPYNQLDKELLPPLRKAGDPRLENVVVELRREFWRRLMDSPADFLKDLRKRLNNERTEWEVFRVLTELLKPEPEGCWRKFIGALVYFYPQDRESMEEVLSKMKSMAHAVFEPVAVEVRREALKGLFYNPLAFVTIVADDLGREVAADETRRALESLAQPFPQSYRNDVLQALASGYELDPASVSLLLRLLRDSGSRVLKRLASEFTYKLLEGKLSTPAAFLYALQNAANEAGAWADALGALQTLAARGVQGRRGALVQALAEARAADSAVVDQLMRSLAASGLPNLVGLQLEIRVASLMNRFFVPKAFSRFFTPK